MSRAAAMVLAAGSRARVEFREWATLVKLRIGVFVGYAALVGALLGAGAGGSLGAAIEAALWISCVAAASCVFNQVLERDIDARMDRTRMRPLVTGSIRVRDAVLLGAALGTLGTTLLALRFGTLAGLLALATLVAYALVYTPLKRHTSFNTVVGAIPGAMPPLLGYVATRGTVDPWAWALFGLIFVWQFPHFLAIAWLYRTDYRAGGLKMLPSLPGGETVAGRQAFLHALVLIPVSLLPCVRGDAGWFYGSVSLVLGAGYAACALSFARSLDRTSARRLLGASFIYLPLVLTAVLLDPHVYLALASA